VQGSEGVDPYILNLDNNGGESASRPDRIISRGRISGVLIEKQGDILNKDKTMDMSENVIFVLM
jgi:hypothetical protein